MMTIKTAISHSVHLRPTTLFRHRHCPDISLHAMPTAPPTSHWQPIRESKSHFKDKLNTRLKSNVFLLSLVESLKCFATLTTPGINDGSCICNHTQASLFTEHTLICELKCRPRKFSSKGFLTLTTKILLSLQQEVSILTGVTWMSTCIRLTVTLPTFLDKHKKLWLSHAVNTW